MKGIKARIEQHINETKHQITMLEEVLDRNGISRSVLKDSMSKMAAMGQSIGGMFPSDEIVKGSISGYVSSSSKLLVIPPCWRRQKKLATLPQFRRLKPF